MSDDTNMRYEVTMPDGTIRTRFSKRTYAHAVIACRDGRWYVAGFCGSHNLAVKRAANWTRRVPAEPGQVVPVAVEAVS